MVRLPSSKSFNNALKILNVTVAGGTTVLLSTFTSCYLAVLVEKTAHRVQYHFFPHWYKDVDFALGLDLKSQREASIHNSIDSDQEIMDDLQSKEEKINKYIIEQNQYHKELNKLWSNITNDEDEDENYYDTADEKHSHSLHNDQNRKYKFEIPETSFNTTENANGESIQGENGNTRTTTMSNMSSLLELVSSNSSENMSASIQNCAMTS